ncbi:MAG TPA: glycoside hydrolase family 15 protein [Candidatus Limnocylindrales bacterium]
MSRVPIAEHALLSDCHGAALVTTAGSVDWLCLPRFDSPSVFGRLLDDGAGHWAIAPAGGDAEARRRYLDQTLVLETTFRTPGGTLAVTDAMCTGPDNRGHTLGKGAPRLLIRSVACTEGSVEVEMSYAPRPEYGLLRPILAAVDGGVTARGGAEWLVLTTPVPLRLTDSTATARFRLAAGQTLRFALHRSTLEEQPAHVWGQDELAARLENTVTAWRSWSDLHQNYDGPWRDLVHHSGRVLQGLTFQPSGAIVAAATTSLPEGVGGERNWDYRYAWVRDASLTMEALWVAACPDEAGEFFAFMTTAAATMGDGPLQIMFGVGGEHDLSERTLPHLRGWRDSRPVRAGNAAWNQRQIDVYGELLDAAYRLADNISGMDEDMRAFLVSLADSAARRWPEKDRGIWEVRGEPRHFVHSKVMCWVALDRAIKLAGRLGADDRVEGWSAARDEIWHTVTTEGYSERAGAFTQYFGSDELDAANLMMPIVGFLPANDPRMLATIEAVAERLTDEQGLVYRYRAEAGVDGLAGAEGTFLLCTFWLAHALALAGKLDRATEVFERAIRYVNDVGLLAEQVDPATGELLGNFPQAFSHIGLVNAAWAISEAHRG